MSKLGVVIARFQVPHLTMPHKDLLSQVADESDHVLVLLGVSLVKNTKRNPLDYEQRRDMVNEFMKENWPGLTCYVAPINDMKSDHDWSKQVDNLIFAHVLSGQDVEIFYGRDSFVSHYHGSYKTKECSLNGIYDDSDSGTVYRESVLSINSPDFRAGMVYATQRPFPHMKSCVDMGCIRSESKDIFLLMGKKVYDRGWRLPGGFVDPNHDKTLEDAVRREFFEETQLTIEQKILYVSSSMIDDWRYQRVEEAKIMSTLFTFLYSHGKPKASDDLAELDWIDLKTADQHVIDNHRQFVKDLQKHWLSSVSEIFDFHHM